MMQFILDTLGPYITVATFAAMSWIVLSIVLKAMAYSSNGVEGWQSFIPMLNDWAFAKEVGDEGLTGTARILIVAKAFAAYTAWLPGMGCYVFMAMMAIVVLLTIIYNFKVASAFNLGKGIAVLMTLLPFAGWAVISRGPVDVFFDADTIHVPFDQADHNPGPGTAEEE